MNGSSDLWAVSIVLVVLDLMIIFFLCGISSDLLESKGNSALAKKGRYVWALFLVYSVVSLLAGLSMPISVPYTLVLVITLTILVFMVLVNVIVIIFLYKVSRCLKAPVIHTSNLSAPEN